MGSRGLLVALIVAATAAFVTGAAIERNTGESGHHDAPADVAPAPEASSGGEAPHSEADGESAATHAKETAAASTDASAETPHGEFRPLGMNIEAWSFVSLAALISLGLALAAWLRPRMTSLLTIVALTMAAFAALDVNEVIHQLDVDQNGLAVLAAGIALLHAGACGLAAATAIGSRRPRPGSPGATGPLHA